MPYATGTHTDGHPVVYDSGDYRRLVELTLDRFDRDACARWREDAETHLRGLGIALFVEKSGIARWEYARVALDGDGATTVYSGSASLGQGVETVLAQICAARLGVAFETVNVVHGDTAVVPDGMGAFGSRATTLGGAAVLQAADRCSEGPRAARRTGSRRRPIDSSSARRPGRRARGGVARTVFARAHLAAGTAAPSVRGGDLPLRGHDLSLRRALRGRRDRRRDGRCQHPPLLRRATTSAARSTPALVEGQIVGGVAQGIGGALLEELAYDEDGQLVTGSFMDYLLPTAAEVPHVDVLVTEDAPTPRNPLGAKGAGEGGTAAVGRRSRMPSRMRWGWR